MPLTITEIRNAKPGSKPKRLYDEYGLYLEVSPAGGKWWRFKYRFGRKEKRLSLGVFPTVSLREAREVRDRARDLLRKGIDPSEDRKNKASAHVGSLANTFEAVAREWFELKSPMWVPAHRDRVMRRFERDIFPAIGGRPISQVSSKVLLEVMRKIESRGALETTRRALADCQQVLRYAVVTDRIPMDPSSALRGALRPTKPEHFAAQIKPLGVAIILRKLDQHRGTPWVRAALRLQPMLFCRPGELRKAEWTGIDLDAAEWQYTVIKGGIEKEHIVPLSRQAVAILRDLQPVTGRGRYVFPVSGRGSGAGPMSDNAVLTAMRRLGIPKEMQTGHGWRATARTMLAELLKLPVDIIEHQLSHLVRDPTGEAYNRTTFLPERRDMMQRWSDYLDELKGSPVT